MRCTRWTRFLISVVADLASEAKDCYSNGYLFTPELSISDNDNDRSWAKVFHSCGNDSHKHDLKSGAGKFSLKIQRSSILAYQPLKRRI